MSKSAKYKCHSYIKLRGAKFGKHATAGGAPWTVPALCAAYQWPTNQKGGGVIGIVELGGGWTAADIAAYFQSINQPVPNITDVSVDGTTNSPGTSDADFEVALDIEVAGAAYYVATGKPATIRVYWSQDIPTAVAKATADGCAVCSISWGADEAEWGVAGADQMQATALAATQAGMAVFAAAGDNDSSDGGPNRANVDVPATCPNVVGCGGTSKTPTAETVWNNDPGQSSGEGTGGGYSRDFKPMPAWQVGAPKPPAGRGRMVPDVAADADPNTGYEIFVRGAATVVGGTSAVAPLYAGLFASFGVKLGFVNPELWAHPDCFTDITVGNNGAYHAGVGPDPCTGLGVPIGTKIAAMVTGAAAAAKKAPVTA
jgi:kumamolisin